MLYKLRWQVELSFKHLKSGSNLRGVNTKEENIVLPMLIVSMIADMLKILIVRALDAKYKKNASLYRVSVHTKGWFAEFVHNLLLGNMPKLQSLLGTLKRAKGSFSMVRQSRLKEVGCHTLKCTIETMLKELAVQGNSTYELS